MLRFLLYAVILVLFTRAVIRLWRGVAAGMRGEDVPGATRVPQRGVQMARDPICGTFVIRENALTLSVNREQVYFCSDRCRDKYRAEQTA
jgi:YHS domain-containing protein